MRVLGSARLTSQRRLYTLLIVLLLSAWLVKAFDSQARRFGAPFALGHSHVALRHARVPPYADGMHYPHYSQTNDSYCAYHLERARADAVAAGEADAARFASL